MLWAVPLLCSFPLLVVVLIEHKSFFFEKQGLIKKLVHLMLQ